MSVFIALCRDAFPSRGHGHRRAALVGVMNTYQSRHLLLCQSLAGRSERQMQGAADTRREDFGYNGMVWRLP
jgi:hypothetical protein